MLKVHKCNIIAKILIKKSHSSTCLQYFFPSSTPQNNLSISLLFPPFITSYFLFPLFSVFSALGSSTLLLGKPLMRWSYCWDRSSTQLPPGWFPRAEFLSWGFQIQQPAVFLRLLNLHGSNQQEPAASDLHCLLLPAETIRWWQSKLEQRALMWKIENDFFHLLL